MTDHTSLRAWAHFTPEAADLGENYPATTDGAADIRALLAEVDRLRAQVRRTVFARETCGNEW